MGAKGRSTKRWRCESAISGLRACSICLRRWRGERGRGLGYLLSFAQSTFNSALMLAIVLLIMTLVLVIFALAGRLEKYLLRWN